jgi:large subunit ribosomal protein L13
MANLDRKKHIIDADGVSLGRVATQAALILMGKNKASYVPNLDLGDFVEVKGYKNIKITGDKMNQKLYWRPTSRVGKLSSESLSSLIKRRPNEVLRRAVYGMLPKNSLRKEMIKRLSIVD